MIVLFSFYALAEEPSRASAQENCQPSGEAQHDMAGSSAESDYECGMALASLGQSAMAAAAFEAGQRKAPGDKRFPIELAGLAFRAHDFGQATRLLHRALHIDSSDAYANNFLGTVYFLDGNLEAALKYWNRAGKPVLQNVTSDPQPQLNAALLDRAFMFAPGTVLTPQQLRETQQRLDLLQVFANYRFDPIALPDGHFDLLFRNTERNGWGDTTIRKLVNLFGNLPFQTVTPDVYNLHHEAANFVSLYRFDAQKRRVFASFSAPLQGSSRWRYGLNVDLRKENWDVRYPTDLTEAARNVTMEKAATSAQLEATVSPDWRWTTGVEASDRSFLQQAAEQSDADATFARDFLQNGAILKYITQLQGTPLRAPERRFEGTVTARMEVGKWWTYPAQSFEKFQGGVRAQWMPQARGDDYAFITQLRAGKSWGALPLDELNMLGVDNDSDLWLRGHSVVQDGKKGAAPMGRNYVLFNNECDKNVYRGAWFNIKVGPFLDAGRITDPSGILGSQQWLLDTGAQIKVRLFDGVGLTLSYGRGVTDGTQAFHAAVLR